MKEPYDENRVRNIPMPTRRATLKEATRVFVELSTVTVSPISLLEFEAEKNSHKPASNDSANAESKPSSSSSTENEEKTEEQKEKGTAHLKKREEKPKPIKQVAEELNESAVEPVQSPEPLDLEIQRILDLVTRGDRPSLTSLFARNPDSISTSFTRAYLEQHKDERVQALQQAGLVTVAAAVANAELVIWLMEQGADPTTGGEPPTYMATKNKAVRLALRRFWGMNPTLFDYEAAGIPSPLTQDELDAIAEREREKKRKEKAKKKEKKHDKTEAAKPPEQRARELRAAAAEARRQGNMSANFNK